MLVVPVLVAVYVITFASLFGAMLLVFGCVVLGTMGWLFILDWLVTLCFVRVLGGFVGLAG